MLDAFLSCIGSSLEFNPKEMIADKKAAFDRLILPNRIKGGSERAHSNDR